MELRAWILRMLGEVPPCNTCEVLKQELALAHNQNEKLLNSIIAKPEPVEVNTPTPLPIGSKFVPWHIKRAQLEQIERDKAAAIRANFAKKDTEDLEKEVLLEVEGI